MSLKQRVLPSLYNGISRQPAILRSPDQNEYELNTWQVLAEGLGKRPPTEDLAHLGAFSEDAFMHHINRDVTERYIVVIDDGLLRVFDYATGAEKTVNAPSGLAYLSGGKFRAVTVADYTFIVNTEKVCAMSDFVGTGVVDVPHSRWLNNNPPDGFLGVIMGLARGSQGTYTTGLSGSFAGEVASVEKLPETAPNGALYKITGSTDTGFTSFYVVRNGAVWDEAVKPGLNNSLDQNTLPHALVREADGTFTFAPFAWAQRRTGDEGSNPPPTFIGRKIRDVFFYQNRLGLLVDENVVFSCAGDFGNYWRNTVLDYVASDVIDVAITTTNVALLNFALPFNDGIIAFADQTQFSITNGEDGLTPSSVAISPITRYEVNTKVSPVAIGSEVYFCGDQNGASIIWEYTRQQDSDGLSAAEVTAHVADLIPARLHKLVAAANLKALFALTGGRKVYAYQFYWNGNEKVISAWREWEFGGDVVSAEYLDGFLYLLVRYPDGVRLERMNLEANAKPDEQDQQVFLDRRAAVTGVYDPVADRTTFTFPYKVNRDTVRLVRPKTHATRPGSLIAPSTYEAGTLWQVKVPGNETGLATGGNVYTMRLQFSRQFAQDYQGRAVSTGRLQLRTFTVNYSETGFFRAEVRPYGAAGDVAVTEVVPAKLADFTGMVVGANDLILNRPAFHTGSFSFQVYGDAAQCSIALTNDTHVASTFVSAEWEGFFTHRALR